jgi:hypothetical protein
VFFGCSSDALGTCSGAFRVFVKQISFLSTFGGRSNQEAEHPKKTPREPKHPQERPKGTQEHLRASQEDLFSHASWALGPEQVLGVLFGCFGDLLGRLPRFSMKKLAF